MQETTGAITSPHATHGLRGLLLAVLIVSVFLLVVGRADYPNLHTALDSATCVLSAVLALSLWDMGSRADNGLLKALALSFAATWLLEFAHVMVTVEWHGRLEAIAHSRETLRPTTWPPAAYVLPIGVLASVWAWHRGNRHLWWVGVLLLTAALGLLALFYALPRYSNPSWLNITRPTLVVVPVVWGAVSAICWRQRAVERVFPALTLMAAVLVLAHIAMLYSSAPHDTQAMIAHLGKVCAYLVLLLSLMQMAAADMLERIRMQHALADANATLERRVEERTKQLESANAELQSEFAAHQQSERALAQSHAQMQAIFETALDGVITINHEGRITEFTRAAETILGYRATDVIGQLLEEVIIPPALRERHRNGLARHLATGVSTVLGKRLELPGLRADGKIITLELSINRMPGEGPPFFAGFVRDITARLHAEQRLGAQLERFSLLDRITRAIADRQDLRSIFQVVIRSLEDHLPIDFGCLCSYEPGAASITVTCVGVRSRPLALQLAMPEQACIDIDENGLSRCVHGQLVYEPDILEVPFPFPQRLAASGLRSVVMSPLLVESNVFGVLVAARHEVDAFSSADCEFLRQLSEHVALAAHQTRIYTALQQAYDELRDTQRTVMQQERLRALGQMASGIAHDINNALSPVALYTDSLLEHEPGLSQNGRGQLTTIQRAIDDVAQTVSRMREFYRPREPQMLLAPVDLNLLVRQAIELTRARWCDEPQQRGVVIDLQSDLAAELPPVLGAESEIRDALTNLIFNAVDAMPEGGQLVLRSRALTHREGRDEPTSAACIEVVDTGTGMDEETRRRCLEPFFTTKGERGSGLGLAMVYGMVQRHSGDLEIDSALGRGTTMRVIFRGVTVPASGLAAAQSKPSQRPARPLRVLVVDDDPLVIESLRYILQKDGHTVIAAEGGQAGVEAFSMADQRGEPFAVVITDLGMPHFDGRRVAAAIRALSPTTPIILLTGWGQRLIASNDIPPEVSRVLSKPPKIQDLRTALEELTRN